MGFLIICAVIFVLVAVAKGFSGSSGAKPGDPFTCPGFGNRSAHPAKHNSRTVKAGGTPYCNRCHEAWLKSKTPGGCMLLFCLAATVTAGFLFFTFR